MVDEAVTRTAGPDGSGSSLRVSTPAELVAAREAAGLSQNDISQRIKLQVRQVAALDQGDWDQLPGRAFVRGALRSYGRLIGADVGALVDSVGGTPALPPIQRSTMSAETDATRHGAAMQDSASFGRGGSGRPVLWALACIGGIVALVMYFGGDHKVGDMASWLKPDASGRAPAPGGAPGGASAGGASGGAAGGGAAPAGGGPAGPAAGTAATAGGTAGTQVLPGSAGTAAGGPAAGGASQATGAGGPAAGNPAAGSGAGSGMAPAGAGPVTAPAPGSGVLASTSAAGAAAPTVPAAGGPASAGAAAGATAAASAPSAADAATRAAQPGEVRFQFRTGDIASWIEVKQSKDAKVVMGRDVPPNTDVEVLAVPPLRVSVGNPEKVTMKVDGAVRDLKPHVKAHNVARIPFP